MEQVELITAQMNNMKTNRKNKRWFRNPDQIKTPKMFNVNMVRNSDGSFHVLGGGARVLVRKNQHVSEWANVDVRDFACELRRSTIKSF
jgi:hypothetical protein